MHIYVCRCVCVCIIIFQFKKSCDYAYNHKKGRYPISFQINKINFTLLCGMTQTQSEFLLHAYSLNVVKLSGVSVC